MGKCQNDGLYVVVLSCRGFVFSSSGHVNSFVFISSSLCFLSHRMLLEKSSDNRLVFSLTVSERAVALRYGQTNGLTSHTISFRTEGRLQLNSWTHITLQVRNINSLRINIRDTGLLCLYFKV